MARSFQHPIRTLIVDDEPLARLSLSTLLHADEDIELVGECQSGTEAVNAIRMLKPELVWLDVEMPGCNGFEVLEQLGLYVPAAVIFVTAYDHYAVQAFEAEALDYLLKPFNDDRFGKVLERAKAVLQKSRGPRRRIAVKANGRMTIVLVEDIEWIEAADYYACLHVKGKTHLLRQSLTDLESELDADEFCRTHRSAIVNLSHVREVVFDRNGDYHVLLADQTTVRLSRAYRERLQDRLVGSHR